MQLCLVYLVLILNFTNSDCTQDHKNEKVVENFYLKYTPSLSELTLRSFSKTSNLKDNSRGYYFWQNKVHLVPANHYNWDNYQAELFWELFLLFNKNFHLCMVTIYKKKHLIFIKKLYYNILYNHKKQLCNPV